MVTTGGVWPTAEQELLLRAALWSGERAIAAWLEWASRVDVVNDLVDEGSFRLLPLVYRNLDRVGLAGPSMSRLKGVYRHSWAKGPAILTISHDREVIDFADELYTLRDGVAVPQSVPALTADQIR
jgi:hypothetical protein